MLAYPEVGRRLQFAFPSVRDGSNPIERKAVYRAQLEIRSMPASLVVQIALWPDKLADWAKETSVAPSVVYNMLANVKPYHRVRTLLARRLNVPKEVLDHLIEAARPEPFAKLPPEPPEGFSSIPPPPIRPAAVAVEPEPTSAAPPPPETDDDTPPAASRRTPPSTRPRRVVPPSQTALKL